MDRKVSLRCFVGLVLCFLSVFGCAPMQHTVPSPVGVCTEGEGSEKGWWRARFQMNWPENKEPAWHMDALLAHRVVAPVLVRHRPEIGLWRFHRRAARDNAGHQFSLLIYAAPDAAKAVFQDISASRDLEKMKREGIIARISMDETGDIRNPKVEDTSDRNWSLPIQQSWPYFIMGASEMWLRLISLYAESAGQVAEEASARELGEFYLGINDLVNKAWQAEGEHAFLHHMNAIFGYEPLVITEKRLHRF